MAQVFRDMRRAASLARKKEAEGEDGPAPEAPPGPEGPVKRATLKQRIRSLKRLLNSNVRNSAWNMQAGSTCMNVHPASQTLPPKAHKDKRRMLGKLESAVSVKHFPHTNFPPATHCGLPNVALTA